MAEKEETQGPAVTDDGTAKEVEKTPEESVTKTEFKESPEDVEKARAFHQTQSQEKSERIGDLESQLEDALDQFDDSADYPAAAPAPADKPAEEPEYDDPAMQTVMSKLNSISKRLEQSEQQNAQNRQDELRGKYQREVARVNVPLNALIKEKLRTERLTEDEVRAAVVHARDMVPDTEYGTTLGAPTRRARALHERMELLELRAQVAKKRGATRGDPADKVEQMKQTAQPASGAAPTPEAAAAQT
ncbi:MAG: hypothetical protein IMY83_03680, partial [Chloroflexi bacterium]|nr:hypothetical protein [Chloroflexota bacterium]